MGLVGVRLMPNYMQPWVYMMALLTYEKGETHQMKMVLNSLQVALHKEEWSLLEKWWPSSWGRLRHRKFYLHLLLCTQLLALSPEPLRCSAWYYSTKAGISWHCMFFTTEPWQHSDDDRHALDAATWIRWVHSTGELHACVHVVARFRCQGFIQWGRWGWEASPPEHPASPPKGRGKKEKRREREREREGREKWKVCMYLCYDMLDHFKIHWISD